jgi:hypothetical protein
MLVSIGHGDGIKLLNPYDRDVPDPPEEKRTCKFARISSLFFTV